MLKKILIGLLIVVGVLAAILFYLNNRNRTLSPPGSTSIESDQMEVTVEYSRPSVRERLIFGEEQEDALLPYGDYWRLGANEPTTIEVSADFLFGGDVAVKKGKYVLFAFPRKSEMELVLNSDLRFWGYTEPDYTKDVARVIVPVRRNQFTEQFTINTKKTKRGADVVFEWADFKWALPVDKQR